MPALRPVFSRTTISCLCLIFAILACSAHGFAAQKNLKQAIELMKQQRDDYTDLADYYIQLGLLYEDANKDKQAREYYRKAEELAAERPDIQARLLAIYNKHLGVNHKVLEYQREIALDNRDFDGTTGIGEVHAWQTHLDQSIELYTKALQSDPHNADWLIALAKAHEKKNNYRRAQEVLDTAERFNPDNQQVLDAISDFKKNYSPEFDFQFSFEHAREQPSSSQSFSKTSCDGYGYQISSSKRLTHAYSLGVQFNQDFLSEQTAALPQTNFSINQMQFTLLSEIHIDDKWYIRPAIIYVTADNFGSSLAPLTSREHMLGGYLFLTRQWRRNALTVWYARDPEIITPGAKNTLSAQNTWAVSNEYFFNDDVSLRLGGSLFLIEDDDRFATLSFNPRYRFPQVKNLSVEYQFDYFEDNPRTFFNTLTLRYSNQLFRVLNYELAYQFSHNSEENSYLNFARAFLSFDISKHTRLDVEGSYGREIGDDNDTVIGAAATLVANIF